MKFNRKQIHARALDILEDEEGGIRWGELLKRIHAAAPETPPNSIHGALQILFQSSHQIIKVARGTYQLEKYVAAESSDAQAEDAATAALPIKANGPKTITEQDFYQSFANWLEENDEATIATELGGSSFGGKWADSGPTALKGRTAKADIKLPIR